MQRGIHPIYVDTVVECACGNKIEVGCNVPELKIDICSNCHPFYTGTHKMLDTEGRVERFKNRYANAAPRGAKK
jgi:large subunit ribosomal protein L31